ncbi:hypothetical protein [Ekhidna sp.]|uniref:hypothetical protein n=1 Tax=Ekhidna sp. TaxID=2608089 RepID=UPI003BA8BDB4
MNTTSKITYAILTFLSISVGIFLNVASTNENKEDFKDLLKPIGTILAAAWREDGNAILYLTSDQVENRMITISLTGLTEYPFDLQNDPAFFSRERIIELVRSSTLTNFKLQCGLDPNTDGPMSTTLVFWSEDLWQGTPQYFFCGQGFSTYEIEDMISNAQSLCIVSEVSGNDRIRRCSNGPACDDAIQNSDESDIDCGGSCQECREGMLCNSDSDCLGDCVDGVCHTPTCSDGIQNQNESDIDCGGRCKRCQNDSGCNTNEDCASSNCESNICVPMRTCSGEFADENFYNYTVYIRQPRGCAGTVNFLANSLNEARSCAFDEGYMLLNQVCIYEIFNTQSGITNEVEAGSENQALSCSNCITNCDILRTWSCRRF